MVRQINELRGQYDKATRLITLMAQPQAYECSLQVLWILGKHKKPFNDSKKIKECMAAVAETLLDGKEGKELKEKVKQIPISATSTRRAALLFQGVQTQFDCAVQRATALPADESTDMNDNGQLLVYIRFYLLYQESKAFVEDVLSITSLKTRREDIYSAIKEMLTERRINLKNVYFITTDGVRSMVGREIGAVTRLKEDKPDLLYHYIIIIFVPCFSLSE